MKILLGLFIILSCSLSKTKKNSDIITIRITKEMPTLNEKGKVDHYITQYAYVHFSGNLRMYETPYYYDSIVNNEKVASDIRYKAFVHHKDSIFGSVFDASNHLYNARLHKDSFTSIYFYTDLRLIKLFEDEKLVMQSSERNNNLGTYNETYTITSKQNINKTGLAVFHYNSTFNDIDFSFSKELDSLHKMKLCEVMIQTNAHVVNTDGLKIDTLRSTHKMELFPNQRLAIADNYFSLYKTKL